MKHTPILAALLLSGTTLLAQTVVIPGYATLQNSGGRSAFPLELSVSEGAKITKTVPATGYFEITCPASGEYFLDARKAGYELVNPRAAHLYFFEHKADADTVRLALNREGAWLDLADRYYRAGMTTVTRAHEARLAKLQNSTANPDMSDPNYRKALDSLATQVFRANDFMPQVAERIAQTDLDRCSAAYRAALRLFAEGDADAALDGLRAATGIPERLLRARLYALTLHEEKARDDYEAVCTARPDDYQLAREYVNYLYRFPNLIDVGQAVWAKKTVTARHANDRAIALHAIGAALSRKNKLPEALEYLHKAAEIREPLAAANPFFAADYAFTCQVIGLYEERAGNNIGAMTWFKKAAAAWAKSPNACAFSYCVNPAGTKTMLAYAPDNAPADTERILLDAAANFDRLAEHYTAWGYLVKTEVLSRIAHLRQNNGDLAGASAAWRELASIFEEYEEEWPLLIDVYRNNFWLPMALAASSAPPNADDWLLSKGIEKLRASAQIAPETFDIPLARCLNQRSIDQLNARNEKAGLQSLEEARLLAERYREQRAPEVAPLLANNSNTMGFYYMFAKDFQKAIEQFEKTVAVYRGCNQCQQYQMNADLSIAHQNIGDAWMRLEQPQKAITSYSEAADVHRYVLAAAPNIRTAKGALQIWFGLAYAQAFVAINTGDVAYKEAARKSIAEAEAVLAQFPNEPGLADFRTAVQEFKSSLRD